MKAGENNDLFPSNLIDDAVRKALEQHTPGLAGKDRIKMRFAPESGSGRSEGAQELLPKLLRRSSYQWLAS